MGEFMQAVAVRHNSPEQIAHEVIRYAATHGLTGDLVPGDSADLDSADVAIYPPAGAWTVLTWPLNGAGTEPGIARALSAALSTVTSWLAIHDSDFWTHVLYQQGQEHDRFASVPDYFTDDPVHAAQLRSQWAGHPNAVAAAVDRSTDQIVGYFRHLEEGHDLGPVFPDDEAPLSSPWVCLDFWRRIGVHYPPDNTDPACGVELPHQWQQHLPTSPELSL